MTPFSSQPSQHAAPQHRASVLGAAFSALVGACARATLPSPLRSIAYKSFARAVGANLQEVEQPLASYVSLGAFFARRLRPGAREVLSTFAGLISPCDGRLAAAGDVHQGSLIQAKGRDYSLAALLGDSSLAAQFENGTYRTIYLSPRDYHRVHAPCVAQLLSYRYIPGALWPVSQPFVNHVDQVFASNERAVLLMQTAWGPLALVMVAAAGVGNLWLSHWSGGRDTRDFRRDGNVVDHEVGAAVGVGDELGAFQLGSTVVMVMGSTMASNIGNAGQEILLGQPLMSCGMRSPECQGGAT
jgi:phosphatidylserine decarboxylase